MINFKYIPRTLANRQKTNIWIQIYIISVFFGLWGQKSTASMSQSFEDILAKEQKIQDQKDIHPLDVIKFQARSATAYKDSTVAVTVNLSTLLNFSLYKDELKFSSPLKYVLINLKNPTTNKIIDPIKKKEVLVYSKGEFVLLFNTLAPYEQDEFEFQIRFLGCTAQICLLPYTQTIRVPTIKSSQASSQDFPNEASPSLKDLSTSDSLKKNLGFEDSLADSFTDKAENMPLFILIFMVFLGGLLTNLTPCVYPMIPITIRLLSQQTQKPFVSSIFYSLGIMITYGLLGIISALSGSMFGQFMASTAVNIALSALMAVLAISMLGYGNFAGIQQIGHKLVSNQKGYFNAFLMGCGAGLVASPCTGPILAALLTYTAQSAHTGQSLLLMSSYSFGFAVPYIFLGSISAQLSSISISAKCQNVIKTIFAGIMFALSFYYARIPLYRFTASVTNQQWTLTSISCLVIASSIFLFIFWQNRFGHKRLLIIPSIFLGFALFSATRIDFSVKKISWIHDENQAIKLALKTKKPLLIDMWAEWCAACKKMDQTTFQDERVIKAIKESGWILVKLDLTKDSTQNEDIQKKYKIVGLPTLVFVPFNEVSATTPLATKLTGYTSSEVLLNLIQDKKR